MPCCRQKKIYHEFKKDFLIEKQIARHFVKYSESLSNPPSFLKSRISANHEKEEGF